MKKLLLALPFVAGASWAGTTYYSGTQTQPAYNRLLEQLNALEFIDVESIEFNSGFIKSTAITSITFDSKSGDDDPNNTLYLHHDISHSPVSMVPANARFGAAKIKTTLMIDRIEDDKVKAALRSFDTGTPFVLNTQVEIDGETNNVLTINGAEHTDQEVALKMEAGTMNILTKPNGEYSGSAKLGAVSFKDLAKGLSSTSDGSSINYRFQKIDDLLFDALVDFKLNNITVSDGGPLGDLVITDVGYKYEVNVTGDDPNISATTRIGDISHPMVPIKSLNQDFKIDGFVSDAMFEHSEYISGLMKSEKDVPLSDETMKKIIVGTFVPGTKLSTELNATTEEGPVDANINFTFIGNGTPSGHDGMETIGDLARSFTGAANIKADTDAIMNSILGPMLQGSPAMNYLVVTDEYITLDAELNNLKLKINGETIPLDLLIGHMLDEPISSAF